MSDTKNTLSMEFKNSILSRLTWRYALISTVLTMLVCAVMDLNGTKTTFLGIGLISFLITFCMRLTIDLLAWFRNRRQSDKNNSFAGNKL